MGIEQLRRRLDRLEAEYIRRGEIEVEALAQRASLLLSPEEWEALGDLFASLAEGSPSTSTATEAQRRVWQKLVADPQAAEVIERLDALGLPFPKELIDLRR